MAVMRRPTPFSELVTLRDVIEPFFDERIWRPMFAGNGERGLVPALDLFTTPEAVVARVALPGVKPENVDITIADEIVTITGSYLEEKESKATGYVHKELGRGTFTRTFSLPAAVRTDAASATFRDGLLVLTLPKTEAVKEKHVKVEIG
ncbi:MAG TPA: Hsp20/alpha crystallin family protein [Candidatus Limnocylindrales bacterium]|jgi:HSP20 family protein